MKTTVQAVKGTRDFYPPEMALRSWLYAKAREVSEAFGYQEYDAPFLETLELYAAKSGDELVKEQSFVFTDRGGDTLTLRPELTPSLARMVALKQRSLTYPLRWWSWGPFWRYERPQKGRSREFFQWNIDLIGPNSPEADAELVAIAATFLHTVGLSSTQVRILVNDRRLMNQELSRLGIVAEKRKDVLRLIDRRDKMPAQDWQTYAAEIGLSDEQFAGLKSNLDNTELWKESPELSRFFKAVQALNVADYVHYSPGTVRGLEYYTGTVFEVWDLDGEFRAIIGGGRYDNLVSDVGGEPLPGVGFAMGDMVVSLVLKKFNCIPQDLGQSPADVLVTVFDAASLPDSLYLASMLRSQGLKVVCFTEGDKLSKQFKYADKLGVRVAVVLGPDEIASQQVTVKNLQTSTQQTAPQGQAAKLIREILACQAGL